MLRVVSRAAAVAVAIAAFTPLTAVAQQPAAPRRLSIERIFRSSDFRPVPVPSIAWSDGATYVQAVENPAGGTDLFRVDPVTGQSTPLVRASQLLGSDEKQLQAVQSGTQELYIGTLAPLSAKVKEVQVWDLPFLFANEREVYAVLNGPSSKKIFQAIEPSAGMIEEHVETLVKERGGLNPTGRYHTRSVRSPCSVSASMLMRVQARPRAARRSPSSPTPSCVSGACAVACAAAAQASAFQWISARRISP